MNCEHPTVLLLCMLCRKFRNCWAPNLHVKTDPSPEKENKTQSVGLQARQSTTLGHNCVFVAEVFEGNASTCIGALYVA